MKTEQKILIVFASKDGSTFSLENEVTLTQDEMKKFEAITDSQIVIIKNFTKT